MLLIISIVLLAFVVACSSALWLVLADCLIWKASLPLKILLSVLWIAAYVLMLSVLGQF